MFFLEVRMMSRFAKSPFQQGIELGPNLVFLGAGDVAIGAFVLRSRRGRRSLWLMMVEF
jgi:hypothetical protein